MPHYLADSRAVLQINDPDKLIELLIEQNIELVKQETVFGHKVGAVMHTNKSSEIRKRKKNIARIKTRLSQLRLQGVVFVNKP